VGRGIEDDRSSYQYWSSNLFLLVVFLHGLKC
jgi:hypothetical protein